MVINSPCLTDKKELAIPGQTETGKEFSNPLMVIVDFLSTCLINYALTVSPTIYASYIEQFWNTATSKTVNSVKQIHAIVDGKAVVISESSVRNDLLFDDEDGITCLTNDDIFENLALIGYEQLSTKLTFQKGSFSPQWKFLIHTILHCISSKSTGWNEFSTNLASAVICLAKGQKFNFSKLIFDGMLRNLDSKKFLMYPRFLQLFLNNQLKDLPEPFNDTYDTPSHTKKVFLNIARQSKGFSGKVTLLFDSMLVQNHAPEGEGSAIPPEPQPTPSISQPNVSEPQTAPLQTETPPTVSHEPQTEAHIEQILPSLSTYHRKHKKTQKHRRAKKVTELPQTSVPLYLGADEAVHKEGGDSMERAITTDASLVAAQDSGNPRRQETIGGALAQTRSERVLEKPNEPPLPEGHTSRSREGNMEHTFELMDTVPPIPHGSPLIGGYTPGSDKGRLKLNELMAMCTKLSKQVLDLEKEKDAQAVEILKLKQRVKSSDDDLDEEDASEPGRKSDKTKSMFKDSDFDVLDDDMENVEGETVNTATTGVSAISASVTTAGVAISTAELRTPPTTAATAFIDEDLTIGQTLVKMRSEKAKEKGVAFRDVEETPRLTRSTTTLQHLPTIDPKDKGKGVLVEEEPEKSEKVKRRDQGLAQIQEEATNAALAEEFDEIQARMNADHELAVRLTHEEQEKYTIEERATLLAEYFERRKKQLAAERAEEIRNKPPTRAQLYQKEQKWINDFKPMDSEEDGSNTKKTGKRIKRIADSTSKQKSPKKSKVIKEQESAKSNKEVAANYEQEKEELRMWLAVVPDEDETVDPEILSVKYPIVNWESQNLGSVDMKDIHIRLNGFAQIGDEKKLYENYGVHSLLMDGTLTCFNMLVEKRYPLIKEMLKKMLNWKLEAEAESTMAFELLKFIKSQFRGGLLGIMDFYNLVLLIELDTAGDAMAAPVGGNVLARRVVDDLIDFSGQTSMNGYMNFFKAQQIAKARSFVNQMREKVQTSRNQIAQLNALIAEMEAFDDLREVFDTLMGLRDGVRVKNAKLIGLNELVTQAEEEIEMKEAQLEVVDG
ncbi:hypothetical protein Tco_0356975 [Tanacetum coccineum]